jgi:hypothetical protein|tara:strand:+ start:3094 stop:3528 length:435 start_codon:yes stop_codon:yes gene_type:complete
MVFNNKIYNVSKNKNAYRLISIEEYNSSIKTIFNIEKHRLKKNNNYYELNNDTCCLIYLMNYGLIGCNKITENNYESVFERIYILEKIILKESFIKNFNPKTNKIRNFYFTKSMVEKNIGITTKNNRFWFKTFIDMCVEYKLNN